MNSQQTELLQKLEHFSPDLPEAVLPFSARLASENNWPLDYAHRVLREYKRFAFLAVVAGHPVSPSEAVDQAWHLHLTYTQNYWKVFCDEILQKPLHHHPTTGGPAEQEKFQDWYARTLQSYRTWFGEEPPREVWPSVEEKQNARHQFVRVDKEKSWVIPKLSLAPGVRVAAGLAAIIILPVCCGAMNLNPFDWRGPEFLLFYFALCAGCLFLSIWLRQKLREPGPDIGGQAEELDPYAMAFLNGGRILAVNTAIAHLIREKYFKIEGKARLGFSQGRLPQECTPLERSVFMEAHQTEGTKITEIRLAAKPAVETIAQELKLRGLIVTDEQSGKAILYPLLVSGFCLLVGLIKILVGLNRDRPVGFLMMGCVAYLVVSLIVFVRPPLRSRKGDAVLEELKARHTDLKNSTNNFDSLSSMEFTTGMGLFGLTFLADTSLADLRKSLQPPPTTGGNSGSSCGSGCSGGGSGCGGGGGGCGGGCGGCGGGGH